MIERHVGIMQQNGVYDLLKMLEISLEEGFPIIPRKYTIVKTREIETLIDRIYASLPVEVQEARAFLRRREELQIEAQQKAEKIISDAQKEADRKLSEADFIKALERQSIIEIKIHPNTIILVFDLNSILISLNNFTILYFNDSICIACIIQIMCY